MGEITRELREQYPRVADLIPAGIAERISQTEVLDRLDAATDLLTKADKAPQGLAPGYSERARALCRAEPRDETEQRAQVWVAKAEAAVTGGYRETCLAKAAEIRAEQPQAPRRVRYGPDPDELLKAQAVAKLQADVARAAEAERARQLAEDTAFLAKIDAIPNRRGVTRRELQAMVRVAFAQAAAP